MQINPIKQFANGVVIGSTNSKDIKDISYMDYPKLTSMFNVESTYLGVLENMNSLGQYGVQIPSMYLDLERNYSTLYTNGIQGALEWEIELDHSFPCVVEDIEDGDNLGIAGSTFRIKLTVPFAPNSIISYDKYNGVQLYVHNVEEDGDGYVHTVAITGSNVELSFPKERLQKGTVFEKIDTLIGEYDTKFPNISHVSTPATVKLEYTIGSGRGIEVAYTAHATSVEIKTGAANDVMNKRGQANAALLNNFLKATKNNTEYIVTGASRDGKGKVNTIDSLLQLMAVSELISDINKGMIFNKGFQISNGLSTKKVNEGFYHLMKRGNRYTYANKAELRNAILAASDKLFQHNMGLPTEQRRLKFRVGRRAEELVYSLFKDEFNIHSQLNMTHPEATPSPVLTRLDNNGGLKYNHFTIKEAYLAGIGNVSLEHDPSFDYTHTGGDAYLANNTAEGLSPMSWSMAIYDITDPMYSNAFQGLTLPSGASINEKFKGNGNFFLVKPQGITGIQTGFETGRMHGSNVASIGGYAGETFFCSAYVGGLILDLDRVILIEKDQPIQFMK